MREIMGYIDVAQVTIWLFWLFFAGLIVYLRREDRREGYPLESDTHPGRLLAPSLIFYPSPKTFRLASGATVSVPTGKIDGRTLAARATAPWPGAPLTPTGVNPMLDSIGPGSWAERADLPDMTYDNHLKIVPVRVAPTYAVSAYEDPRGYDVIAADRVAVGKVSDLWVDRSESVIRYFEVTLDSGRRVLVPVEIADLTRGARPGKGRMTVTALFSEQFADVPGTRTPDSITRLEEERIVAYYGAGSLYASPRRAEPLAMSHDDFAFEPIPGLPELPPEGERVLWQGAPDWRGLAWRAFHVREVSFYFAVLIAAQPALALVRGDAIQPSLVAALWIVVAAVAGIGILGGLAYGSARSSVYTITSRRLVMRIGIALPVTINLPFAVVTAAGLRLQRDGAGDLPVALAEGQQVSYAVMWPHVRPWRVRRAEPMLRAVPDAAGVADCLARALAAYSGAVAPARTAVPVAANDARLPQGVAAAG